MNDDERQAQRWRAQDRLQAETDWTIQTFANGEWVAIGPEQEGGRLVAYADDEPALRRMLRRVGGLPVAVPAPRRPDSPIRDSADVAKAKGYTGIPCEACGSMDTVRIGSCLRCSKCNSAGGCG
jgi:hypothetical protein